ncbi:MAG: CocE/NonD family hydrolase [Bacillota bacterium]|nr:CocE/NonD family hydrolase [Bacillota bacterium]
MHKGPFEVIVEPNVMVRMRDGVRLAADVHFPALRGRRLDGPFPAVVERTPYGKQGDAFAGAAQFFASYGYVSVVQDCRGRFASEGVHITHKPEPQDGYDTIEWVAAQPWCDGKVGTTGLSYGGGIQGSTGALKPPHLKSMVPAMGFSYVARVRKRTGGAARLSNLIRHFRMIADAPEALENPSLRAYLLKAEENLGQWLHALPLKKGHNPFSVIPSYEDDILDVLQKSEWSETFLGVAFDVTPYYDEYSDADVCLIGGWYDSHSISTVEGFRNLRARKRSQVSMIMGPYKHGAKNLESSSAGDVDFGPRAAMDYNAVRLHWFDMTLKGLPFDEKPPVRIFVMGGGTGRKTPEGRLHHGGAWRYEHEWPIGRAEVTPFYLHAGGGLSRSFPEASSPTAYSFDPKDPVPTIGGPVSAAENVMPGGGFDQVCHAGVFGAKDSLPLAARHDVCVFQTAPLAEDTEVTGVSEVVLYASSDCPDTDFTVKLIDVYPPNEDYPPGYALNIQDSIIRARYRNRKEPPEFIAPGQAYPFRIPLFPTSNVFKKGHWIRLDISSSNFPRFDVNPNTGEPLGQNTTWRVAMNSVYHDEEHPSHVLLPVVR